MFSKNQRHYLLFVEDMHESMNRIEEYIKGMDFEQFRKNYLVVDAVVRNLEIIGEASNKIPEDIKNRYPQIPWDKMYGLRNRISHEYFGLDYEIIWEIISKQLPDNKEQIKQIIRIERK